MTPPEPASRPAPAWKSGVISLAFTVCAWLWLTWPLPLQVTDAIPSHTRRETQVTRALIPGDHLQLLYHFWLFSDVVAGKTPLFHNLYEFNAGDDSARRRPSGYFLPAAAMFTAGKWIGGEAFGWNFAFVLSLWIGFWAAWRLARRFVDSEFAAFAAAMPALLMPYRWAGLCDGSPAGFGMAWTPAVLLLLTRVWDSERRRLAVGAVFMVWMSVLVDMQAYYFTMLLLPGWLAFLMLARPPEDGLAGRFRRALPSSLPILAAGVTLSGLFMIHRNAPVRDSVMQKGRSMAEVAIFSPKAEGFLGLGDTGLSNDLLLGHPAALAAAVVLVAALLSAARGPRRAEAFGWLLLLAGAAGALLLCLGANGPGEGRLFDLARRVVPKFDSVRQPMKILVLLTALLPVFLARALHLASAWPRARLGAAALTLVALTLEYRVKISPRLCSLGEPNRAYAAVAEDCDRGGGERRVLALPLWPGDSSWSSLYLHHFSTHRLKGLNGYSPVTSWSYFEDVFLPLRSLNQGDVTDAQLDRLLGMGIRHLTLHENAFPDKVSPWPVAVTLHRLRRHPRLEPLAQDAEVHAFRIRSVARAEASAEPEPDWWFPTRCLGAELGWPREQWHLLTEDATASGRRCVELHAGAPDWRPAPLIAGPAPDLRWMLRVRGEGGLQAEVLHGGRLTHTRGTVQPSGWADAVTSTVTRIAVSSAEAWTWVAVPVALTGSSPLSLRLRCDSGRVRVDELHLAAGRELRLSPGESVTLPAHLFFHAGHTDDSGAVVLRPSHDPDDVVIYGPSLPLEPGDYEVTADPPAATPGWLSGWQALPADATRRAFRFRATDNLAGNFGYHYPAQDPLAVKSFTLRRLAPGP